MTNISWNIWNIETFIYLCIFYWIFNCLNYLCYLCSFNHNTISNVILMYFRGYLYLTGCKLWWMRMCMSEWMNELFTVLQCDECDVWVVWMSEWLGLIVWDLFSIFNHLALIVLFSFILAFYWLVGRSKLW